MLPKEERKETCLLGVGANQSGGRAAADPYRTGDSKTVCQQHGHYAVHRMTYRGEGGWSWPLTIGPLQKLLKKYLKHVGTEQFFELM